jgi:hypothetical protein
MLLSNFWDKQTINEVPEPCVLFNDTRILTERINQFRCRRVLVTSEECGEFFEHKNETSTSGVNFLMVGR